ncbi:MAG: CheY-like chemotaxis protein [Cellvibrionaceae bacterium]|jgi:CheY-like chemotaxis protein
MSNNPAKKNVSTFSIGVDISFMSAQRRLITSVCGLSSTRSRLMKSSSQTTFEIINLKNHSYADTYIVNANQPEKSYLSLIKSAKILGIPIIIVGDSIQYNIVKDSHFIELPKLGASLLKHLDITLGNRQNTNKRCLVVDDSELVRTQMKMIFDKINVKGSFAENGSDAILRAQLQNYDLIFLDVMLPDMDGYEICKVLKKTQRTLNTPIIMLTSKSSPFNRIRGIMVGCDKYLTKPIETEKITNVVNEYCNLD